MYVTLYKSCAPGYLRPVSLLSPVTSVSPTEVLPYLNNVVYHAGSTTERYAQGCLHAKPSASTIRNYMARTHNARLKSRYNLSNGRFFTVFS